MSTVTSLPSDSSSDASPDYINVKNDQIDSRMEEMKQQFEKFQISYTEDTEDSCIDSVHKTYSSRTVDEESLLIIREQEISDETTNDDKMECLGDKTASKSAAFARWGRVRGVIGPSERSSHFSSDSDKPSSKPHSRRHRSKPVIDQHVTSPTLASSEALERNSFSILDSLELLGLAPTAQSHAPSTGSVAAGPGRPPNQDDDDIEFISFLEAIQLPLMPLRDTSTRSDTSGDSNLLEEPLKSADGAYVIAPDPTYHATEPACMGTCPDSTHEDQTNLCIAPTAMEALLDRFRVQAIRESLTVRRIPRESLRQHEQQLRAVLETQLARVENEKRKHEDALQVKEAAAVARLHEQDLANRRRLLVERQKMALQTTTETERLRAEVRRNKQVIQQYVREKCSIVQEKFGSVVRGSRVAVQSWQVQVQFAPQSIEIRVHFLRAVKTKLPEGRYVVMASIYDSLGGQPLIWSRHHLDTSEDPITAVTQAVTHLGSCLDRHLRFESSCFVLCPPPSQLRPSNVLVLELFQLAGPTSPFDRVAGWTALPLCTEDMTLAQGRFKLPMLRGEHSPSITQFREMEESVRTDLGHWLCNAYFEIRCADLGRVTGGTAQWEPLSLHVSSLSEASPAAHTLSTTAAKGSSGLTRQPGGGRDIGESTDENSDVTCHTPAHTPTVQPDELALRKQRKPSRRTVSFSFPKSSSLRIHPDGPTDVEHGCGDVQSDDCAVVRRSAGKRVSFQTIEGSVASDEDSSYNIFRSDASTITPKSQRLRPIRSSINPSVHDETGAQSGSDVDTGISDVDSENSEVSEPSKPNVIHKSMKRTESQDSRLSMTGRNVGDSGWRRLVDPAEVAQYSPALTPDPARHPCLLPDAVTHSKLRYISAEAFGDLHWHLSGSLEFYLTLCLYQAAIWSSLYVHYLGQYLFLLALGTPVYNFQLGVLYVQFKYQSSGLTTAQEVEVVEAGALACLTLFLALALAVHLFYQIGVSVPDSVCKYTISFGAAAVLDPVLVLLVDIAYHNYDCASYSNACSESYSSPACNCFNGDFSKLWLRMSATEGSGITGLLITIILYASTAVAGTVLVYYYIVHVHRNGRILDLWRRVHADTEAIFVPDDYEVSYAELRSICLQAGKWRGIDGSTRELTVMENPPPDLSSFEDTDADIDADGQKATSRARVSGRSSSVSENSTSLRGSFLRTAQSIRASLRWPKRNFGPTTVIKLYRILETSPEGHKKIHRQFAVLVNGSIIEVINQARSVRRVINQN